MEEIKTKLKSITANYKQVFSDKLKRGEGLLTLQNRYSILSDLTPKITNDLIDAANKYFKKNDIDNTSDVEEIIKCCVSDFVEFGQTTD